MVLSRGFRILRNCSSNLSLDTLQFSESFLIPSSMLMTKCFLKDAFLAFDTIHCNLAFNRQLTMTRIHCILWGNGWHLLLISSGHVSCTVFLPTVWSKMGTVFNGHRCLTTGYLIKHKQGHVQEFLSLWIQIVMYQPKICRMGMNTYFFTPGSLHYCFLTTRKRWQ